MFRVVRVAWWVAAAWGAIPAAIPAALAVTAAAAVPCMPTLVAPVDGPIVAGFRAPDCRFCPGRRGVVFASTEGAPVRAPVSGRVLFAGRVAGSNYVVVGDPAQAGLRVTVGRLTTLSVTILSVTIPAGATSPAEPAVGRRVAAGEIVGAAGPTTWLGVRVGTRRGGTPVDPLPLLRRWRVALVPSGRRSVGCGTAVAPSGSPGADRRP